MDQLDSVLVHYVLSYGGAAGLCLLLILFNVVVPKRYYDKAIEAKEAELAAERDKSTKLTEANTRLQAALDIERATNERLTSSGQLTNQLVGALITIAGENRVQQQMTAGSQQPQLAIGGGTPAAPPQQAAAGGP